MIRGQHEHIDTDAGVDSCVRRRGDGIEIAEALGEGEHLFVGFPKQSPCLPFAWLANINDMKQILGGTQLVEIPILDR